MIFNHIIHSPHCPNYSQAEFLTRSKKTLVSKIYFGQCLLQGRDALYCLFALDHHYYYYYPADDNIAGHFAQAAVRAQVNTKMNHCSIKSYFVNNETR